MIILHHTDYLKLFMGLVFGTHEALCKGDQKGKGWEFKLEREVLGSPVVGEWR